MLTEPKTVGFVAPESPPTSMLNSLCVLYDKLGDILHGYLVEVRESQAPEQPGMLLIALHLGPSLDPERVARDSTTVIQETYHGPFSIDLTVLDDTSEMAQNITSNFPPSYSRGKFTNAMRPRIKLQ